MTDKNRSEDPIVSEYYSVKIPKDANLEDIKSTLEAKRIFSELKYFGFSRFLTAFTAIGTLILLLWQINDTRKASVDSRNAEYVGYLEKTVQKEWDKKNTIQKDNEILSSQKDNLISQVALTEEKKYKVIEETEKLIVSKISYQKDLKEVLAQLNAGESEIRKIKFESYSKELSALEDTYKKQLLEKEKIILTYETRSNNQNSEIQNLEKVSIAFSNLEANLGQYDSGETGRDIKRGEEITVGDYKFILTNVGNILKNIDIKIINKTTSVNTKISNLNEGTSTVIRFDKKLFFIEVEQAVQAEDRDKESGQFKVTIFDKPYLFAF
jgi:hypothetical protein